MTVSIHQPNYIPWLGYFYKIYESDLFVFLDDVQFSNKAMHEFHNIKTAQGLYRLKIPVKQKFGDKINEVCINNDLNWKEKHLKTIEAYYKKAKYFNEVYSDIEELFAFESTNLSEFNKNIVVFIAKKFGLVTAFTDSSLLGITTAREDKVLDVCNRLNANVYLSGLGARIYQDEKDFSERKLILKYSAFKPFEYPQLWGVFESNVSIVDYLMNCGYDWDRVVNNQLLIQTKDEYK